MNDLRRILLVEDDPLDVELCLNALEAARLANEVLVVRDGREALDYLTRQDKYALRSPGNPVVILLDLKMPRVGGLEVLEKIRSTREFAHIPVVVLTSSREERDIVRSYDLGVNAYVVKPVDFHQFNQAVRDLGLFWGVVNHPPPGSVQPS